MEKLLTLSEASAMLGLPEEKIRQLVENNELPAYHIGGMYLRFKEDQLLLFKEGRATGSNFSMLQEKEILSGPRFFKTDIRDFLYFNDFYIISSLIAIALFFIILRSIR